MDVIQPLATKCLNLVASDLSKTEREAIEKYITDSVAAGLICPSSSPVGVGFFFVELKDRSLCPCIDYTWLNEITIENKYPLPDIDSSFSPLHEAELCSQNFTSETRTT